MSSSGRQGRTPFTAVSRAGLSPSPSWLQFLMGLLIAFTTLSAVAQVHEARRGDLVLRASTVASDQINPDTASSHGIEPSPTRGVLNVVLLRGSENENILADVTATSVNLAGVRQSIEMRQARADGQVSYLGTYDFLPRETVDFEISATPQRPVNSRPLTLNFRDRIGGR